VTEQERLAAGLRYLEQQKKADPLESFRSLEGLKGAYERRVQPIINNAMQTFETGGAIGDLLRAYGSAAAPANAAVLEGMGMPYRGPITAPRQEGVSSGENFRAMGDPRQQAVGQMIGDPANLAQPVGARLANALKFAKPDAMKMVQEMSRGAISPMDVYHGSPHRFAATAKNPLGEFDPTKIGSGEGAQVYGYGHYLAETPDVAKGYQPRDLKNEEKLLKMYQAAESRRDYAAMEVLENAMMHKTPSELRQMHGKEAEKIIGQIEKLPRTVGSMYKVDLPDEVVPRMLDWDKPLSQQPENVREAFEPFVAPIRKIENKSSDPQWGDLAAARNYDPTGRELLQLLSTDKSMTPQNILAGGFGAAASERARSMGIPGIQYLDAGSRGAATGTRNFVVFPGNEGLLNILGRE
jgi:hypothetical protein